MEKRGNIPISSSISHNFVSIKRFSFKTPIALFIRESYSEKNRIVIITLYISNLFDSSSGAGCTKAGYRYPPDSDFFNRRKNT